MKILIWNLGWGDCIALSSAAVILAEKYGPILAPCQAKYIANCTSLFANHPLVLPRDINDHRRQWETACDHGADCEGIMALENGIPANQDIDHYSHLYRKLGLSYEDRWRRNIVPAAAKLVEQLPVPDEPYQFVHDDARRGFIIRKGLLNPKLRVVRPFETPGISALAYADLIENAEEGNYIDSSMCHLAQHLNPKGKLLYHRYARPFYPVWADYSMRHDWEILT